MLELPLLPAVIFLLIVALAASLGGVLIGGRIGYNDRLRRELQETVEEMRRRTDEYRAAHNMSPLTPTFAYGRTPTRRTYPNRHD